MDTNETPAIEAESSAETLMAALVFLMSHHARTGCPRLALCISRHMQCLAMHPDAAPVLRDVCAGLQGAWQRKAVGEGPRDASLH